MAFGLCSKHQDNSAGHKGCDTCRRIALEGEIAGKVVDAFLAKGYFIDVFDCKEFTVKNSQDKDEILDAMFTTDDDRLYVRESEDGARIGWIWFVYGNGGWDVIADYTTNLDSIIDPILKEYD